MNRSEDESQENLTASNVRFREVAPAMEFVCWIALALAMMLRWVNGPAVTDDQFAIQIGLVSLAAVGAIVLRIFNWRMSSFTVQTYRR